MKIKLTAVIISLFFLQVGIILGQEITGIWISTSVALDDSNVSKLTKDDGIQLTFNSDGSYTRVFYVPKDRQDRPLYKNFEIRDGQIEKSKFFDEDGYERKMIVVTKRTEVGQYEVDVSNNLIRFITDSGTQESEFRYGVDELRIKETIDEKPFWIILVKDKKRKRAKAKIG